MLVLIVENLVMRKLRIQRRNQGELKGLQLHKRKFKQNLLVFKHVMELTCQ